MFIIAALLFNAGLLVLFNYGSFFDTLKNELNKADTYYIIPNSIYKEEAYDYIKQNEHINKTQTHEVMVMDAKILSKGEEKTFPIMFCNMEDKREISKWKYVGEHLEKGEMSVYVPDVFKAVSGYELNDKIKLKYIDKNSGTEKTLTFTVKGYTEDIFFSSTDTGYLSFYLPEDTYNEVANILNNDLYKAKLIYADLDNVKNVSTVESGVREALELNSSSIVAGDPSYIYVSIDIELIELSRCMMATLLSVMMVVFALIIVVVCLLVVRFRINNSIEEDIMKIGSLKSVGYTSKQIILSVVLQFLAITALGSIIGIALSYSALPAISTVFEQQSGLKWEQGFDVLISSISLFIFLIIIALVTLVAARHIKKLSPIHALRGETIARKNKRNHLPLDKAKGRLSIVLAIKSILQNIKQNIMIAVILIAVSSAGAFGVIMYYNTAVDLDAFKKVPGFEICNAIAVLNPEMDQTSAIETIKNMDSVRKVQYLDESKIKIDGSEVTTFIMDTYSKRETVLVYEGRYPKNSGEITLAGVLADRLGKKVNDTVTVRFGDNEKVFKVVGLSNGAEMGGLNSSILVEDFKQLNPNFKQQALYIYLEQGKNAEEFIEDVSNKLDKEILLGTTNFDKALEEGMASYQSIVGIMGVVMLIITILVVALVLYFMISSTIIRKRRDLGIQKAIGFTTIQLMNQISISFIIPVIISAVIGSILGALYTNPLLSVFMKGMGIMKAQFIVDYSWVIGFGIAVVILSYLLSMLITLRIRKISAYSLVTE